MTKRVLLAGEYIERRLTVGALFGMYGLAVVLSLCSNLSRSIGISMLDGFSAEANSGGELDRSVGF